MGHRFHEAAFTDAVLAAQADHGRASAHAGLDQAPVYGGEFGEAEVEFIAARDSFYLATLGEGDWPYVQHRGGPVGFVEVIDPQTLVFPDYRGNGRSVSLGNIAHNPRVCIFMMDYERRTRLKIMGAASLVDASHAPPFGKAPFNIKPTDRHWMIKLEGFDWNRRQYIPRRFSEDRVRRMVGSLQEQIRVLKHKVSALQRAQ